VAEKQELQVQKKQEVEKAQESTTPTRAFIPSADIYESEDALTVVLEMPGMSRDGIDVTIEDGVLTIEGRIDFSKYDGLQPLYSEYNVGPYRRSFRISSQIEQGRITAKLQDGIITLDLPKAEATKPRRIQVS
jgi:HSP20 family molecular chaperone IbpA